MTPARPLPSPDALAPARPSRVGLAVIDAPPSAPQWVILGLDAALIF